MSKFLSEILVPRLMRDAGMSDADEERAMTKISEKLRQIKNTEDNSGRVEDVEEEKGRGEIEQDHDGDASKQLKESSVEKIVENEYDGDALEGRLREKFLNKPELEAPLTEKKMKSSSGRSGEGSSSRDNKINPRESEPAPPLPVQFKNSILALAQGRTVSEEKLVIQKQLFASDVAKDQNRFTIPENQIREEFLSNEEKINLLKYERKGRKMSVEVKIIEPSLGEGTVELRRWELKKSSGHSRSSYVLNKTWGKIRENNKLVLGDVMQLWAVRIDGELLFVLVKVT